MVSSFDYFLVKNSEISKFIDNFIMDMSFKDFLVKTNISAIIDDRLAEEFGSVPVKRFDYASRKTKLTEEFYKEYFETRKVWPKGLKLKHALYLVHGETLRFNIYHVSPKYLELHEVTSKTNFMSILSDQLISEKNKFVEENLCQIAEKCFEYCCKNNVWLTYMTLNPVDFDCLEELSTDDSIEDLSVQSHHSEFQPKLLSYTDFKQHTNVKDRIKLENIPQNEEVFKRIYQVVIEKNSMLGLFVRLEFVQGFQRPDDESSTLSSLAEASCQLFADNRPHQGQSQANFESVDYEDFSNVVCTSTQQIPVERQLPLMLISPLVEAAENDDISAELVSPSSTSIYHNVEKRMQEIHNSPENVHEVIILNDQVLPIYNNVKIEINHSSYQDDVEEVEIPVRMDHIVVSDEEEAEGLIEKLNGGPFEKKNCAEKLVVADPVDDPNETIVAVPNYVVDEAETLAQDPCHHDAPNNVVDEPVATSEDHHGSPENNMVDEAGSENLNLNHDAPGAVDPTKDSDIQKDGDFSTKVTTIKGEPLSQPSYNSSYGSQVEIQENQEEVHEIINESEDIIKFYNIFKPDSEELLDEGEFFCNFSCL